MPASRYSGLFAAGYTPLADDGQIRLSPIPLMVEWLLKRHVSGFYVCGSTGEGMSLTSQERQQVAEAYVKAVNGRAPVFIQVGHNSLYEAKLLSSHAAEIGATAVSATCPSYFKVTSVECLVDCMAEVAAGAPNLPFYYYHIPALTGAKLDMTQFLDLGKTIPNLAGIKFTSTEVHEVQQCLEFAGGRYEIMWGCDEMLLSALVVGCRAAIGSTYNIASPLYARLIEAFDQGDLKTARQLQSQAVAMVKSLYDFPFHPAMKVILNRLGFDVGGCRLPHMPLTESQTVELKRRVDSLPLFG